MNREQKNDLQNVFGHRQGAGDLDFVTCWYKKAAEYIQGTEIECAFVSTNSICQGLQVPIFWQYLLNTYNIKINFAHQTFKWSNEARGKAAVYCVIVGFGLNDRKEKQIYTYQNVKSEPKKHSVKRINAYLIEADNIFIENRIAPICDVPSMNFGNMPADGGEFLFTKKEKNDFLKVEPDAKKYFQPFISAKEFLNNGERWCLWLQEANPNELRKLRYVLQRIENVRKLREQSARPFLADIPQLFAQITQPKGKRFILIPRVSSERRKYIPIGFFDKNNIASDTCLIISNATLYHFGVLTSSMHMTWMRYVCGRLKSDYRYSKDIVYNNFPWIQNVTDKQKLKIEKYAQQILDIRKKYPDNSLAALYDPLTMPRDLLKSHQELDKAVDKTYGKTFSDDSARVAFLFEMYKELTKDLLTEKRKVKIKIKNI
jgi:hypothetical protein